LLQTDFRHSIGTVAWHVPCHQRVQKIGPKTKEVLSLVPDSDIQVIERCSGHDGTYGVRNDSYAKSQKIARPVINRVKKIEADYLVSDCPMAASQIANGLELKNGETNPLRLLAYAYGL
jgi:Fe-S oxidoreductase